MDSLLTAFVLALVTQTGARPAWLLAMLAVRRAAIGAVIAHAALACVAVLGAMYIAPELSQTSRGLLLGLALIVAAVCLVRPIRVPPAPVVARPLVAATIGVAKLALGDRTQFLTFAVAVEGSSPLLAGIGGAAGAIVAGMSALLLGMRGWCRLPWRWINAAGALALGAWGVTAALQGLRIF